MGEGGGGVEGRGSEKSKVRERRERGLISSYARMWTDLGKLDSGCLGVHIHTSPPLPCTPITPITTSTTGTSLTLHNMSHRSHCNITLAEAVSYLIRVDRTINDL